MAVKRLLDLGRGHVLAAADDDVLHPVGDGEVAVLVGAVFFRLLQVADKGADAARLQEALLHRRLGLAGLGIDDLHLIAVKRQAIRIGGLLNICPGRHRRRHAQLRHPPRRDHPEVAFLLGVPDQHGGDRRAGAEELPERAEVVLLDLRRIREVGEEGRRPHREGDLLFFDQLGAGLGVPDVLQHARRLQIDRQH